MSREDLYTPQTPRDESPQRKILSWKKNFKLSKVRIKNYLYFLIHKAILHQSWSILEWKFAEESSQIIRHQLPELYVTITYILLSIKDNNKNWSSELYFFRQDHTFIPRNIVRAAHGVGFGEILDLQKIEKEFLRESKNLLGNLVLLELSVTDDSRNVTLPVYKRGYKDHGSCTPDHKKGRNNGHSREPDPLYTSIGENPNEDVEFLDLVGSTEFFSFLRNQKK